MDVFRIDFGCTDGAEQMIRVATENRSSSYRPLPVPEWSAAGGSGVAQPRLATPLRTATRQVATGQISRKSLSADSKTGMPLAFKRSAGVCCRSSSPGHLATACSPQWTPRTWTSACRTGSED